MTKEQAHIEILEAWRLASLRTTTFEDFQNMIRRLAFVLAKCPEDCRTLVEAAIVNAERRAFYVASRAVIEGREP